MACEALATKAEVAQLRQTVALLAGQLSSKLDKSERSEILQEAIQQSKSQLMPPIQRADNRAGEALAGVGALGITLGRLGSRVNQNSALISRLFALLNALPAQLKPIIISILLALGLYGIAATIQGFINRVDNLESQVLGLLRRFGLVEATANTALKIGVGADLKANEAQNLAQLSKDESRAANKLAGEARLEANKAINIANVSTTLANLASLKADGATRQANTAIQRADSAYALSILAGLQAQSATSTANTATQRANTAYSQALLAGLEAQSATSAANTATRQANAAAEEANHATYLAENATYLANSASRRANLAVDQANAATAKANQALAGATGAAQQTNNLDKDARSGNIFRAWSPTVWQPAVTQWARQSGYTPITVQPISVADAGKLISQQFQQVSQQISAQISSPSRIAKIEADQRIQDGRLQVLEGRAPAATLPQSITTLPDRIDSLERQVATTSAATATNTATIPAVAQRVTNLETRMGATEAVNQQGLSAIAAVGTAVAALPQTLAKDQTYRAAVTDLAAAGTCQTTRPGGCLGNRFDNLQNGQNGLLQKVDQLTQAGQGAALAAMNNTLNAVNRTVNTVNTKLGAQIANGGISGAMGRLSSFLGIDRIFNLLNFLATLHNASMLSASLKITLLETLSSVGNATGLLQTSEGDNVDLNQVFDKGIESFIVAIVGAETWANFQLTWRKHNSIFRSLNNAMSNIGNMFSSIGNGIEIIGERSGKIGNALRAAGVVRENAYNFMSENMDVHTSKFMTFQTKIGGVTQVLDGINELAENVIEGQQSYTEAVKATDEFKKSLAEGTKEQSKDAENKAIAAEAAKIKENISKDPTGEKEEGYLSFLTD